ncbi:dihydrofolate reductase family protein [Patulibacter brassicae]|jgi:dihydrofolate reductase|uniref:Dihydrofolate reductase family protein n=1 Tax=Patulibacter brassicae TaxID=1705717 RepID=A0ABU4VJX1_9ACTN|nr:dihydrofolate reductase family protein [Patulibacter brassicae]MDX8152125.1 dihydrofolate reductase family protein [Patulibacter brassicae]
MTRIRVDHAISVDGFTAGPDQSLEAPLGIGGERLHAWQFAVRESGAVEADVQVFDEHFAGVGAYVMGRNMFGGGPGPWATDEPWEGWWGPEPPYHRPVFVLTHHPREPLVLGDTTFTFVTEGPERALELARAAVGEQDIRIAGGASTVAQYLRMGVVDELHLHVSPVLLGAGERPFDGVGPEDVGLEIDRVIASPQVTHIRYRVQPAR